MWIQLSWSPSPRRSLRRENPVASRFTLKMRMVWIAAPCRKFEWDPETKARVTDRVGLTECPPHTVLGDLMNRRAFLKAASVTAIAASPSAAVLAYGRQKQSTTQPIPESPEQILLKDYRPKSIYKIPVTEVNKARYPIIDMHSHPYAKTGEQIAEWITNMDEVGVEKTIILTAAVGTEFDDVYRKYAKYPERFEVWCGFDFTGYDKAGFGPAAVRELERCHQSGARGVGELHDKGKGMAQRQIQDRWLASRRFGDGSAIC